MSSYNDWIAPLYLNALLTDEEKSIQNTAKKSGSSKIIIEKASIAQKKVLY